MYVEHPAFDSLNDENAKVWRYLDFTKFVSLLDKEALFFVRSDKLADKFEGSYSKVIVEKEFSKFKVFPDELYKRACESNVSAMGKFGKFVLINSWHMNEYESAAMWELYLKSDEGIAIQSTVKDLKESFIINSTDDVFIGKINYIDYNKDWIPDGNLFYPHLHKRKSFEHEKELRLIVLNLPSPPIKNEISVIDMDTGLYDTGKYIPVSLDILVQNIYVSPTAPVWFKDLVQSVVNRYNLKKNVIQSSLSEDPVH